MLTYAYQAMFGVGDGGFDLHFSFPDRKKNYCSHQFLNWWQQVSTGHLHLNGFESHHPYQTKKPSPNGLGFGLVGDGGFEPPKA